jgi:hypothetical protein
MKTDSKKRLSILVFVLVDAARTGGMKSKQAKEIYDALIAHFARMQNVDPSFADQLVQNAKKALTAK